MSTFQWFNPFVWDAYYVPVPGAVKTAVNKTGCVPPWSFPSSERDSSQAQKGTQRFQMV